MGKVKFGRNTMTSRQMRRIGERELTRERRQKQIDAFWAMSPEERAQRIADQEAFQRIQRNGITIEDMHKAEEEAYVKGIKAGKDATVRTCFAAICMTLHELHGFGKDRCCKVLNDVYDKLTLALTSQDAIDEVYEQIGLEIHFSDDPTEEVVQVKEGK